MMVYVYQYMYNNNSGVGCIFDDDYHVTEQQAAIWTKSMLETLRYMHSMNIVHCDLKPENIVFKSQKGGDELLFIDFGLARIVNDDTIYPDLCANKWYTAPEIAQHYLHSDKDSEDRDLLTIPLTGKVWKS